MNRDIQFWRKPCAGDAQLRKYMRLVAHWMEFLWDISKLYAQMARAHGVK